MKLSFVSSAILIFLVFSRVYANADDETLCCQKQTEMTKAEKLGCEAVQKSPQCQEFYKEFDLVVRKEIQLDCKNSNSDVLTASIQCSAMGLSIGLAVGQFLEKKEEEYKKKGEKHLFREKLLKRIPAFAKKVGPKLLAFATVASVPLTINSVYSLINESLESDKKCYENIDLKRNALESLWVSSVKLKGKLEGHVSAYDMRSLGFSSDYLKDKFVAEVSCQRIRDLILAQKKKQDAIIGPLLAQNKISKDPRNFLKLTSDEEKLAQKFNQNIECVSDTKKTAYFCALGNSVFGAYQFNKFIKSLKSTSVIKEEGASAIAILHKEESLGSYGPEFKPPNYFTQQKQGPLLLTYKPAPSNEAKGGSQSSQEVKGFGQNTKSVDELASETNLTSKLKVNPPKFSTDAYLRWLSVSTKHPPKNVPYFALGESNFLDSFSAMITKKLKHNTLSFQKQNSVLTIDQMENYMTNVWQHFPNDYIRQIEKLSEMSSSKNIVFNLTRLKWDEFHMFMGKTEYVERFHTYKEIKFILENPKVFDHVRWFDNGKELSFGELSDRFREYAPNLFY